MSDIWKGSAWNENGELVINVYASPPDVEPEINEFDETKETGAVKPGCWTEVKK